MPRPKVRSKHKKEFPRAHGGGRASARHRHGQHGNLVRRPGPHRPEEQDHPAMGPAGLASLSTPRPAHGIHLRLRRALPEGRQGRGLDPVLVQHRRDGVVPARAGRQGRAGTSCRPPAGPGWLAHLISDRLTVPSNITIMALPAKCPELNPQENVREFMRDNWLSNRVFTSYDNIVDHCADAWNKLSAQPWRIMTLRLRDWAHQF